MKVEFKIEGMTCSHCQALIEKTLNNVEGVKASVNLNPPTATIEFLKEEIPLKNLQEALLNVGNYKIIKL